MDQDDTRQPAPEEPRLDDAARRWETIRQLGERLPESGTEAPSKTVPAPLAGGAIPAIHGRRTLWRRWQVWVAALALVALGAGPVAALVAHRGASPTTHAKPAAPVQIVLAHDLISCPTDMAWSSDLQLMAVLGYTGSCPNPIHGYSQGITELTQGLYRGPLIRQSQETGASQGAMAVYDATSGKLVSQARFDDAIYPLIHFAPAYVDWLRNAIDTGPEALAAINYTHALWSRDGQRLYITFSVYVPDAPPARHLLPGHLLDGLVVTNLQGKSPQVYLHPAASSLGGVTVWDLATGAVRASIPATSPYTPSSGAPSYAWFGDFLTVLTASPLGPVGDPGQGATSFTIWQPGAVSGLLWPRLPGQQALEGVPSFSMDSAALSPDGSLLAAGLGISTFLRGGAAPLPSVRQLAAYGWGPAPVTAPRDAALQAAAVASTKSGAGGAWGFGLIQSAATVAWRPDGRELAMSTLTPNDANEKVVILSCATGTSLATLTPPAGNAGDFNHSSVSLLRWAPNGSRLAFFDATTGALTIWSQASLPR